MGRLNLSLILGVLCAAGLNAQDASLSAKLMDTNGEAVMYANVVLYDSKDSSVVKISSSDDQGDFLISGLNTGEYYLQCSYVGLDDLTQDGIEISKGEKKDLGALSMSSSSVELETAVVTARRAIVEVKSDRTVFNVKGTINSSGDNAIDLLRKAPGLLVDNNDNITVLGRTGVLIFVDGKRLPLAGDDLVNYLQNLSSEQIDRIDIISSPGAKYEAEGNAGVIDIRLNKNENHGTNGSVRSNITRAKFWRNNIGGSLNHRNDLVNVFTQVNLFKNKVYQFYDFDDYLNNSRILNTIYEHGDDYGAFLRFGTDFSLNKHNTIGILLSGNATDGEGLSDSESFLSGINTPDDVDSILIAKNIRERDFNSQTININYAYNKEETSLNFDADFGRYRRDADHEQPNTYFAPNGTDVYSMVETAYSSPTDIDILTFKLDYEQELAGGKLGLGSKLSKIETDNTFLFYDVVDDQNVQNDRRSNLFFYDEMVYAVYGSYARTLTDKLSMNAGLRVERTDARGDLQAFLPELQEPPVDMEYTSYFPSAGLSYKYKPEHVFTANYGRRINRPDYNVLNPFKAQFSELSFAKGNPFLKPEIVNNIELGYLFKYRYNLKLAYSRTTDQITRLIGPDDSDPRARFINWDNLAEQIVYSINLSAPVQFNDKWNAYFNLSASHLNNQADYGDGVVVDIQAFTYNIYQQHTINLPKGFTAEVSGWFNGPGVWGGVFKFDPSWSLNLGLQKKFLDDKLNVRLSVQDIFLQAGWSGYSEFNGLRSVGRGEWDSRRASVSISYNFGNQKVKSRDRKSGLDEEASRVGQ